MARWPIKPESEEDRFWSKVNKTDGCWLWNAGKTAAGYGNFCIRFPQSISAHRWAYEHIVGPIPKGYQIDHLCRVRACVRPDHLEAVTQAENLRRQAAAQPVQTHCKRGHLLPEPIKGHRTCKVCHRMMQNAWEKRRRRWAA